MPLPRCLALDVPRFDSRDRNSDGQLSKDELDLRIGPNVIPVMERMFRRFDWETMRLEELHPSFKQLIKHFDKEGDGHLSQEEAQVIYDQAPFLGIEIIRAKNSSQ